MKTEQLKHKQVISKVNTWTGKILDLALYEKDTFLIIQSYILLELCKPLSQKEIPFEKILKEKNPDILIKSSPSLLIEFLFLMKKYKPDLYNKELANLIDRYQSILTEIWNDSPNNNDVFLMFNVISRLNDTFPKCTEPLEVKVSEDSFLLKSKTVIENNLNYLLMASCYGQKKIELTKVTIEAIETILLDAATKYDLVLASKSLRVLTYAGVTRSYITELGYNFLLKNQSIEGYIGHYEVEFIKTKTEDIAQSQQMQITKEIVLAILEYNGNYRHIRDFTSFNY